MVWICNKCGREFRNKNQWHSCYTVGIEDHLAKRPDEIREIFHALLDRCAEFGEIEVIPVKSSIQFRSGAVFLSLKIKKDKVELEFQLPEEWNDPRILKSVKVSGKRVFYAAVIKEISDVDEVLLGRIKESYGLIARK